MDTIVRCPHCEILVEVVQLNCKIFRCGIYKSTLEQIPPHASRETCDLLSANDEIYGCGRPFRVTVADNGAYAAEICEYI